MSYILSWILPIIEFFRPVIIRKNETDKTSVKIQKRMTRNRKQKQDRQYNDHIKKVKENKGDVSFC